MTCCPSPHKASVLCQRTCVDDLQEKSQPFVILSDLRLRSLLMSLRRDTCWVIPYSFNHLSSLSITVYQGPDMHQACWGVGHKRALFWRLHSNEEKPINVFPKFQSFAYCFQNFGLYAHCPIIVLPLPLAYGWWSHSFIYLRPSAPKCSQKDKLLVYVYIFFHIHEDKPVTLNFKINW